MKKIQFYLLFIIAGLLALNACQEKEDVFLPASDYFVSITRDNALVVQDGDVLKVPVVIAAPKGAAVTVNYSFEPKAEGVRHAVLGKDFYVVDAHGDSVSNYVLTFPEGTGTDTIYIRAPFTGVPDLKIINIVLKSNSAGYKLGMSPLQGGICELQVAFPSLDDFVGKYELFTNLNTGSGYASKTIDVDISKGVGDTLLISGFFSGMVPNTAGVYNTIKDVPIKVYVNINTMTFNIPPQFIGNYSTSAGDVLIFGDWDVAGNPALPLNGTINYSSRLFDTEDYWMIQIFKNGVWSGYYTGAYGAYIKAQLK
ncbi:MAG: hypothetical protein LBN98_03925 [Prevotellaceae bacterium]|jgi:hypothetical protein|nr:hypothetical protein [Prevotellaceae bacterium]